MINDRLPNNRSIETEERRLGRWCVKQKGTKKGNKRSRPLTLLQQQILEKIPGWQWEVDLDEKWITISIQLIEFIKDNKRFPVSKAKSPDEATLGRWCIAQRSNKRNNSLTSERINILEKISGWKWESEQDKVWMQNAAAYREQVMSKKKSPSDKSKDSEERRVAAWGGMQRQNKKGNLKNVRPLTNEQINTLENIPGWRWKGRTPKNFYGTI